MDIMRALIGMTVPSVHHVQHESGSLPGCHCRHACRAPAWLCPKPCRNCCASSARSFPVQPLASIRRPSRREPCRPSVISVWMSASFFWNNCVCASGPVELFAVEPRIAGGMQQNSAAPSTPQEMPIARPVEAAAGPFNPSTCGSNASLRQPRHCRGRSRR